MKGGRKRSTVLALCALGGLTACASGEEATEADPGGEAVGEAPVAADADPTAEPPEADPAALWAHLGAESYAEEWARWPGKGPFYEGIEPHGALLTTYVNPEAADAFETGAPAMPPGAIVVKQNYSAERVLEAVTVMYKVDGYNPEAGDWYWAKYLPDGTVDGGGALSGTPASCIDCHSTAADNDYLRTGPLGLDGDSSGP